MRGTKAEERLDQRIAKGIRSGDKRVFDLVAGPGIDAVREEVRRRELEARLACAAAAVAFILSDLV